MTSAKKMGIFFLSLAVFISLVGATACKNDTAETAAISPQKTYSEYEGTVMTALGRYLYLPTAQGFDIVLQDFDAAPLVGKNVRIKGELLIDHPSIFQADSVEVKEDTGAYSKVFTRSRDFEMEDFIEVKEREGFRALSITGVNKPEEWENKDQGKVYGKLQESTVKEGGQEKTVMHIVISDAKGREIGKIIADDMTTYARYYQKKLRFFDTFWFYLDIKDTVDRRVRPRTRELFRADILFTGLY